MQENGLHMCFAPIFHVWIGARIEVSGRQSCGVLRILYNIMALILHTADQARRELSLTYLCWKTSNPSLATAGRELATYTGI